MTQLCTSFTLITTDCLPDSLPLPLFQQTLHTDKSKVILQSWQSCWKTWKWLPRVLQGIPVYFHTLPFPHTLHLPGFSHPKTLQFSELTVYWHFFAPTQKKTLPKSKTPPKTLLPKTFLNSLNTLKSPFICLYHQSHCVMIYIYEPISPDLGLSQAHSYSQHLHRKHWFGFNLMLTKSYSELEIK